MNKGLATGLFSISGFIAALSQLILKIAALNPNGKNGILQYFDWRIILSYSMLFGTVFLNMIALRYIPYKFAPVLSSLSYVFVLFLGRLVLREKIRGKKLLGALLIFIGMIVFYIG